MLETDVDPAPTNPVATARATHRITSWIVAVDRTIFAKRVWIIFKSMKIFVSTGIEVTAVAIAMIICNASRFFFSPR